MTTKYVNVNNLKVSENLLSFVNNELLNDTQISPEKFWADFDKIVHELAPINKQLLKKREDIQNKIIYNKYCLVKGNNIEFDDLEREFLKVNS